MASKRLLTAAHVRSRWITRRLFARGSQVALIFLALLVGAISGLVVSLISFGAHLLHSLLFDVPLFAGLSGSNLDRGWHLIAIPTVGGVVTALIAFARRRRGGIVDPIEANALYGGHMSLADSVWVTLQNLASNGFGLSAGLEAAYTQLSSGIASKFGVKLHLRREDHRVLVGCGAAGAIAAAFGAPMTGAFYAFEIIIGTYSTVTLAPVIAAAIIGTLVSSALPGAFFQIDLDPIGVIHASDFIPALALGAICAGFGILVMIAVVRTERLATLSRIPSYLRPAVGGALVGIVALVTPQVLSSGHGAMHINLQNDVPWTALLLIFTLKALSSALTIGSGFRGGLFFASLLLGALLGKAAVVPLEWMMDDPLSPSALAIIGMSAFGTAVIGGPLTMTFLALELTGEFPITVLALAASIASSLVVRNIFGYSFSTWRFHLRGETIRSAHDVGWIRKLTVDRLMRRDVQTVLPDLSPDEFRNAFLLGSTQRVILASADGRYCGMVQVAEIHADAGSPEPRTDLSSFIRHRTHILLPGMNARQAAAMFESAQAEALAVVNERVEQRVVGLLTEAHTLRRYSEEMDRRRQDIVGVSE